VGFFFTPIYMFIIPFLVLFNIKKGHSSIYAIFWAFSPSTIAKSITKASYLFKIIPWYLNASSTVRFQFTALTGRVTTYVLFIFWVFFFFFGESLLLLLLNFSDLNDTIPSGFFFTFKGHISFSLNTFSMLLSQSIMFFIIFFTLSSFYFLVSLRYDMNYNYFNSFLILDLLLLFLIVKMFSFYLPILLIFFLLFMRNY
jgi:hypothetical protein